MSLDAFPIYCKVILKNQGCGSFSPTNFILLKFYFSNIYSFLGEEGEPFITKKFYHVNNFFGKLESLMVS